jgi:hypothetical protein
MMKSYILVFDRDLASERKVVTDALDAIPEVPFWYTCFPQCIFLTSASGASEIAEKLKAKIPITPLTRFVVTDVGSDMDGLMPAKGWRALQNPESPRLPENHPPK